MTCIILIQIAHRFILSIENAMIYSKGLQIIIRLGNTELGSRYLRMYWQKVQFHCLNYTVNSNAFHDTVMFCIKKK